MLQISDLDSDQKEALNAVMAGNSSFITGCAGSGKSALVNLIIDSLRGLNKRVQITATTGAASTHIKNCWTLHSFVGVSSFYDRDGHVLTAASLTSQHHTKKKKLALKWCHTDVLIIDEVSMLSGEALDLLEESFRLSRGRRTKSLLDKTFGGLQVVLVGDFHQLLPVKYQYLAFEAKCWNLLITRNCVLETCYRVQDPAYLKLCNEARVGALSQASLNLAMELQAKEVHPDSVEPVRVFAMNTQVDDFNRQQNEQVLNDDGVLYTAKDLIVGFGKHLDSACPLVPSLKLKKGSRVMVKQNFAQLKLVNGHIGTVVGFRDKMPVVKIDLLPENRFIFPAVSWKVEDGDRSCSFERVQLPLSLSFGLTFHKCQGFGLDSVMIDFSGAFHQGQAYSGMTRSSNSKNVYFRNFDQNKVVINAKVKLFYANLF